MMAAFRKSIEALFAREMATFGCRLPLSVDKDCRASLRDADGRNILTIDINRERPDAEAFGIAVFVMMAVNKSGGFHNTATEAFNAAR